MQTWMYILSHVHVAHLCLNTNSLRLAHAHKKCMHVCYKCVYMHAYVQIYKHTSLWLYIFILVHLKLVWYLDEAATGAAAGSKQHKRVRGSLVSFVTTHDLKRFRKERREKGRD